MLCYQLEVANVQLVFTAFTFVGTVLLAPSGTHFLETSSNVGNFHGSRLRRQARGTSWL